MCYTLLMKKTAILQLFISILSLSIGVLIYLIANKNSSASIIFIRNYGADFCWLFSFVFALHPFVSQLFKKSAFITVSFCFVFGTIFEILQKDNLIKGTGDFGDILSYLLATLSSCLLIKFICKKEKNYEKNF